MISIIYNYCEAHRKADDDKICKYNMVAVQQLRNAERGEGVTRYGQQ